MSDNRQVLALVAAGLKEHVLLRDTPDYETALQSWWSLNSRLRPICIVQPTSAEQVSSTVKTLASSGGRFAIRSGGHAPLKGGNNLDDGVTIDLTYVHNETLYNPETKVVSIGPGQRWGQVLEQLGKHNVAVPSGRDGNVGVGGFITGGGITFYSGKYGLACDNLVNAQVVLADGRIVDANHSSHSDLFRALKGGKATAGIVTRFDLPTMPKVDVWGGIRFVGIEHADSCADHLVNFTKTYRQHAANACLIATMYGLEYMPGLSIMQMIVDTDGTENPPAFEDTLALPAKVEDVKRRSMASLITDYALPPGSRNVWLTMTVKNDARIMKHANVLFATLKQDIDAIFPPPDESTSGDICSAIFWQALPKLYHDMGRGRSQNVLGLDTLDGDALICQFTGMCKTLEQEQVLREKGQELVDQVKAYSESIGGQLDWLYVNYADTKQNPLASYGKENVEFLKAVAQKYDPEGVFQTVAASTFNISDVDLPQ